MALSCTKDFTCTVATVTTDMPLDQAVYSASDGVIYAVRGGYAFKLNATTGALISSSRFAKFGMFNASLAHDTTNDKLFVACANTVQTPPTSAVLYGNKRVYKLTPSTLALDASYDMTNYMDIDYGVPFEGPDSLLFGNNLLFYSAYDNSSRKVYSIDPTNFASYSSLISSLDVFGTNMALDGSNNVWAVKGSTSRVYTDGPDIFWNTTGGTSPTGVAVYDSGGTDHLFVCTGTQYIDRIVTGTGAITQINTARANANPQRIRYNSVDGLIYCPLYNDDTVAVIDPSDNSFSIIAGFDAPFDVVFTPTKKFAVQHGNVGLLEIP